MTSIADDGEWTTRINQSARLRTQQPASDAALPGQKVVSKRLQTERTENVGWNTQF